MFGSESTSYAIEAAKAQHTPPEPGKPYSLPLPGTAKEGRTPVYRHWNFQKELLVTLDPTVRTVHDAFEHAANRVPKNPCLGRRPWNPVTKTWGDYVWEDYATIQRRRAHLGSGLVELHKGIGITDEIYGVGLWSQNCPEWQMTDLAAMSQRLFTVSIYDTLGPDTTEYIINHANLACIVTTSNHIPTLLKLKPRLPTLKLIVSMDPLDEGEQPGFSKGALLKSFAKDLGVEIFTFTEVETLGEKNPRPYNPPAATDMITINYTSGTTGDPKGVVLSHKNAIAGASASMCIVKQGDVNDRICSFLPLAHIYQRVGEHTALWAGVAIGYFHGNIQELVDDLKLIRPTSFSGVPRLYNRFGSVIKENTVEQNNFRGALSRRAVSTKLTNIQNPDPRVATNKHAFWDRIWARKVSAAIGLDKCASMVTGSAPIDPSLHQFLRVVFANHFLQGYGLTETYAVALAQWHGDVSPGNCGAVMPVAECCLQDVPDMEYLSTDKPEPRGELLIRGSTVFSHYHKNEKETSKALDEDGWFHTGDICSIDSLGRFRVIDRVKNVLKLSQGEYISPERIENVYLSNCTWLATAYVHGDSHQSCLVAIFGIAPEGFAHFASKVLHEKIDPANIEKLNKVAQDKKVLNAVMKELDKVGRKNKFNSWERVKGARLFVEPFTVENQLLTPTLKLKRPQTAKMYRDTIDELYEEANQAESTKAKL